MRITSNWRAVCGKTASTVRREGRREPSLPLSGVGGHRIGQWFRGLVSEGLELGYQEGSAFHHDITDLVEYGLVIIGENTVEQGNDIEAGHVSLPFQPTTERQKEVAGFI